MKKRTEKRIRGDRGESRAAFYLMLRGYRILERNYTFGHKEIDIIASRRDVIAFVEVKTRSDVKNVAPHHAVTQQKQYNLAAAAKGYCMTHSVKGKQLRFDIAEVPVRGRINYIKNAFCPQ